MPAPSPTAPGTRRWSRDGFVTRRDAERVRADAIGADAARDRSRADRDVTLEQAAVAQARRPVLAAELARAQAAEARARAALTLARQDSGFTLIRAPIAGRGRQPPGPDRRLRPAGHAAADAGADARSLYVDRQFQGNADAPR